MIDKKTTDDLIRFLIESDNGFCSQSMTVENIKKCERWIADITSISKNNVEMIGDYKTPGEFQDKVRKAVWREAFNLRTLTPGEAATILVEDLGERDNFDSAIAIFQRKNGQILPEKFAASADKVDGRMRAISLKPMAKKLFLQSYSHKGFRYCKSAAQSIEKHEKEGGSKIPWVNISRASFDILETEAEGSPVLDDQGNVKLDLAGNPMTRPSVHLVAYKTPYGLDKFKAIEREIPLSDKIRFAYQKMALEEAGVVIDSCQMVVMNDANFTVKMFSVDGVDDLIPQLKEACDKFWAESVSAGIPPERERSNNYLSFKDFSSEAGRRILEPGYKIAIGSKLKNLAEKTITEGKQALEEASLRAGINMDDFRESDKKGNEKAVVDFGIVKKSSSWKPKLDHSALYEKFKEKGGNLEDIRPDGYDETKLVEAAKAIGIDLADFTSMVRSDRFTPTNSKNSEFNSIKTHLDELASESFTDTLDEAIENLSEQFGQPPRPVAPKAEPSKYEIEDHSAPKARSVDSSFDVSF